MTEPLDLDALEAVARAATPGPWEESETVMWDDETPQALVKTPDGALTWDDHGGLVFTPVDAAHIASFDPPTVLSLIGRVREAEAERDEFKRLFSECHPIHLDGVQRAHAAEAVIERVRALLDAPSDERGITWWSWIDGGLGGSLYADLRAALGGDQS